MAEEPFRLEDNGNNQDRRVNQVNRVKHDFEHTLDILLALNVYDENDLKRDSESLNEYYQRIGGYDDGDFKHILKTRYNTSYSSLR